MHVKRLCLALTVSVMAVTASNAATITSLGDAALDGASSWGFEEQAYGGSSGSLSDPTGEVTITPMAGSSYSIQNWQGSGYADSPRSYRTRGSNMFEVVFSSVVDAFAMTMGAQNSIWNMTAYDSGGGVIESAATSGACCGPEVIGIANSGIARIIFSASSSSDDVVLDEFRWSSAPSEVPLPAGLPLLLGGLGILGVMRRKRKA